MNGDLRSYRLPTARPSPRELEIWVRVAMDQSDKEIAEALRIAPRTVNHHRENLHRKLGTHTPVGLTRAAIRHGLIQIQPIAS